MTEPDYLALLGDAQPLFATSPTPGAAHELRANIKVSRALGTPLLPWQVLFARVVSERRLDDPRQYRWKEVIATLPRQVGKTVVVGNMLATRGLRHPNRRAFYTAQTGKDASARWKDLIAKIETAPALRDAVQVRLAAGSQSLILPTGSTIAPFAPTPKSLHGYTPDDVVVDEVFALGQAEGADLDAAIGPAQMTRISRQVIKLSTRGGPDALYLNGLIEKGRAAVAAQLRGEHTDTAYFEWALPEGLDPHDPASWGFHPALGHTVSLDDMRQLHDLYENDPNTWIRGFMNRETAIALVHALDPALIEDCYGQQLPPAPGDLAIAYEVAIDRSRSAIWGSWADPSTGLPAARLILEGPGAEWLPGALDRLRDQLHPRAIGADDGGPTRDVTDELRGRYWWADEKGGELQILGARDFATACDATAARIRRADLVLERAASGRLVEAVDHVVTRTMGQGYAWDRMKSRGPIPDLIAMTVALRLNDHAPAPAPTPEVYFA